jgi:hypothetical protein
MQVNFDATRCEHLGCLCDYLCRAAHRRGRLAHKPLVQHGLLLAPCPYAGCQSAPEEVSPMCPRWCASGYRRTRLLCILPSTEHIDTPLRVPAQVLGLPGCCGLPELPTATRGRGETRWAVAQTDGLVGRRLAFAAGECPEISGRICGGRRALRERSRPARAPRRFLQISLLCRNLTSGGTRIRTGDTMIFRPGSHD